MKSVTVVNVLEMVGVSPDGFQEAVREAILEARNTVQGISGVEVVNLTADVRNDDIVQYKANVKVAFTADHGGVR